MSIVYIGCSSCSCLISENAVTKARSPTSPFDCIAQYEQLQAFVGKVSTTGKQVEDVSGQQKLYLVKFLESIRERTWNDIKGALTTYVTSFVARVCFECSLRNRTLVEASEKLQWPSVVDYGAANSEDRIAFERAFHNLLKLQRMYVSRFHSVASPYRNYLHSGSKLHASLHHERTERDGLYPIQALVQPVSLRFKYHFEGTRQTNRLDKVSQPYISAFTASQAITPSPNGTSPMC